MGPRMGACNLLVAYIRTSPSIRIFPAAVSAGTGPSLAQSSLEPSLLSAAPRTVFWTLFGQTFACQLHTEVDRISVQSPDLPIFGGASFPFSSAHEQFSVALGGT